MNILKGKLSYILASLAIIGGIASLIGGFADQQIAVAMIWSGLAVFGIRQALPKN